MVFTGLQYACLVFIFALSFGQFFQVLVIVTSKIQIVELLELVELLLFANARVFLLFRADVLTEGVMEGESDLQNSHWIILSLHL